MRAAHSVLIYSSSGYRFAIMEIKAILFTLIRDFKFEDLGLTIVGRIFFVSRPTVKGLVNPKAMLPVRVSMAVV
jgi:hypothetical protein